MITIVELQKMVLSYQCKIRVGDVVFDCYEDDICAFCLTSCMIDIAYLNLYNEYL